MGGGGGSSGAISWPDYLQNEHLTGITNLNYYLNEIHDEGDGPYALAVQPSPSAWLTSFSNALSAYSTAFTYYQPDKANSFWAQLFETAAEEFDYDDSYLDADLEDSFIEESIEDVGDGFDKALNDDFLHKQMVELDSSFVDDQLIPVEDSIEEFYDKVYDEISKEDLAEFKATMQKLGAVETSTFAVGESILLKDLYKRVSTYDASWRKEDLLKKADLRSKMLLERLKVRAEIVSVKEMRALNEGIRVAARGQLELTKQSLRALFEEEKVISLDIVRQEVKEFTSNYLTSISNILNVTRTYSQMGLLAKAEEYEANLSYVLHDWTWHIDLFQYHANYLSALGGGTMTPSAKALRMKRYEQRFTTIFSYTSMGFQVGGWPGAIVGMIVGVIVDLFD